MEVSTESLYERYSAMNTEALSDLYHKSELTDLAVSVLEKVITSRGLDWTEFITPLRTEPESLSDWELWKAKSKQDAIDYENKKSRYDTIGSDSTSKIGTHIFLIALIAAFIAMVIFEPERLWGLAFVIVLGGLGVFVQDVRNELCPTCRRWFAFKKTGKTRSITQDKSRKKEEQRECKYCGHLNWVEISEPSSGRYVGSGSGDDDGGGEGTCGGGE